MTPCDRTVQQWTLVASCLSAVSSIGIAITIGLIAAEARRKAAEIEAKASPVIESAAAMQETAERVRQRVEAALDRLDRWENRWRRFGMPVEEDSPGSRSVVTPKKPGPEAMEKIRELLQGETP